MRLALLPAVFAGLLAAAPAAATDGGPGSTWLFQVDWGPVGLAEVRVRVAEAAGTTRLEGAVETAGLGALLSSFRAETRVTYHADGSRLYLLDLERRGTTDRLDLLWPAAGEPVARALPEPEEDEPLTPIPPGETLGTVDPAFPVWDLMARLDRGEGCTAQHRVWDGVRRYDIGFADLGAETLPADRDWTYGGPARACRMTFRRVGGFPAEVADNAREADFSRTLWLAPLAGRHVPVRFRAAWPLGVATARIDFRPPAPATGG